MAQTHYLEDRNLCSRTMARYAFFAIYFFKFYSSKRRTYRLKICEKNDRSPYSFRRKQSFIDLANSSSKGNRLDSDCARARARANDARNYAQ